MRLPLKADKTDAGNRGASAVFASYPPLPDGSESPFCPVAAVRRRAAASTGVVAASCLFIRRNYRNVTRQNLVDHLRRHAEAADPPIDPASVGTHSLRISAATVLQASGLTTSDVDKYVGWRGAESRVGDRYARITHTLLTQATAALRLDRLDAPQPVLYRNRLLCPRKLIARTELDDYADDVLAHIAARTQRGDDEIRRFAEFDGCDGASFIDVPAAALGTLRVRNDYLGSLAFGACRPYPLPPRAPPTQHITGQFFLIIIRHL